ncbi:hypothetical protein APUTEX25_001747, partial [Auxenochlorella protothecoides]
RAFLLLTAVQAFLAGIFAATQIGTSLQDTLLILATSLSLWWLSLDSLLRACAHQLPACAALGTLGVAEMVAFAVAHGADSPGPTAVAALCAALQLAALALCRTAYRQVGWRWAGRMPGDGRLRGTELRKRAALCRSRLGAAARFDAVVLAILSVVMVTEGAPLAGSGAGVALLVGGALGGALLAAWNAAATLGALRRHARLALAADFAFQLSYGPPVIGLGVVVAGGPGTAAGARLAVACVVFLAARATLWWAVRLTWRATRALRAEGEKESRRRPGLTTSVFMQLSEDGSTLRWGWSSSVLLYHVESVRADDPARSLTLTFALGAPLTLRLGGAAAYVAWRTGLAELLPRLAAHADLLTGNDAEAGGTESAGVQKHRPSIKPESSELEGCINIHVLTSPVGSPRWDGDGDAAGHARRRSLAAALEAASGAGRGNVLLGPGGVPKLADFGMSVLVGAPEAGQRHVIGTAAYAAPELLEQGPPAAGAAALKADVYSFGVAVWEALARRRPHQGLDGYQIQTRWMLDPEAMRLPGPGRGRAELDPAAALLWDLVADCTAMDPAARPDMLAVLERLRAGTGQSPPQPHTP